jgi:hypothetical protein
MDVYSSEVQDVLMERLIAPVQSSLIGCENRLELQKNATKTSHW